MVQASAHTEVMCAGSGIMHACRSGAFQTDSEGLGVTRFITTTNKLTGDGYLRMQAFQSRKLSRSIRRNRDCSP